MIQAANNSSACFVPCKQITTRRAVQHGIVATHKHRVRIVDCISLEVRLGSINLHDFASVVVMGDGDEMRASNLLRDQGMCSARRDIDTTSIESISKPRS
jgi:hypothetical protein